ncbi:mitochondrial folate transporter-like protein/carrier [Xylogone sp. PMI_703]|nr:mitochondrial folate transporter-like protein/carrier [Xylogone sp. PMI_703]
MTNEGGATSSPATQRYASSPSAPQQFTMRTSIFGKEELDMTPFEAFCVRRSDSTCNAIAGATGGFMSGIVTCPLDVIKTKLQAQGAFLQQAGANRNGNQNLVYRGMLGTAKVIWKEEGVRGMYRGLGPIILGYLPTWAVWFTVYGKSKEYLSKSIGNPLVVNFWSSIIAGASSTMVTNPIWVIKTRLMSQVSRKSANHNGWPPWQYKSTLDAFRKMYRTEGFLSFYSGLTPALLGLTHVAVQFPAYEYLKTKFTGRGMGTPGEVDEQSHWLGVLSASVISKVMASSATYPHEVIRTRLQTQQRSLPSSSSEYVAFRGGLEGSENHHPSLIEKAKATLPRYKGIVSTFKTILREEGWRAFYAGMGTNMMRAVPAATTTMVTYEFAIRHLNRGKAEGKRKLAAATWE